jgi:hypothetical protein
MSPPLLSRCDQSAAHGHGQHDAADQKLDLVDWAGLGHAVRAEEDQRGVGDGCGAADEEQGAEGRSGEGHGVDGRSGRVFADQLTVIFLGRNRHVNARESSRRGFSEVA